MDHIFYILWSIWQLVDSWQLSIMSIGHQIWNQRPQMAQIARKLPIEAKPRMVNYDLGYSLFMDKGRIRFFFVSGEKGRLFREIRAVWPLTRKTFFFLIFFLRSRNFFQCNYILRFDRTFWCEFRVLKIMVLATVVRNLID